MLADVTAYETAGWHDLFVASAGASAALAGLVFVAVSVNVLGAVVVSLFG